jgi:ribonuclease HI
MSEISTITLPEVPRWEPSIGDTSSLYRNCSICRESKFYQCFPLKGGKSLYRRRRYCIDCAERMNHLVNPIIIYRFDVNVLDDSKYGFIYFIGPNKKWCNKVTLQEAIRLVSRGKARIRTPYHIVLLTDSEPFIKYILDRDSHRCQRCENPGTEAVRLPEVDMVKCYCVECAKTVTPIETPKNVSEEILFIPPPDGEIQIYCDGSVTDDTYGCGAVLISTDKNMTYSDHTRCAKRQHSFYAELLAISLALRCFSDFLNQERKRAISVTILTDATDVELFLLKSKKQLKDVYIAKEVQEIKLLLHDLKKEHPQAKVNIRHVGSSPNQLHHLAHRLSRSYKRAVPAIIWIPTQTRVSCHGW